MDVCPLTKSSEKGHSTIIEGVEDVKQIQICKKKKKKEWGAGKVMQVLKKLKLARRENTGVGAREGGAVFQITKAAFKKAERLHCWSSG